MDDKPLYGNPNIMRQGKNIQNREKINISPETAEMVAGFHPILGPALSAKDFSQSYEDKNLVGMGLASLGMVPMFGGVVKPISKILRAAPSGSDILNTFKTSRGSVYAHHADNTTTRNRSGAMHRDTTEGMQPRSGKTIFVDPKDVNTVGSLFQNTDMATKVVPKFDNNGTHIPGKAVLQLAEDYGPRKAGTVLHEFPYKTNPEVGFNPLEIYRSESPIGDSGSGIHFGNTITEVTPQIVAKKTGGFIDKPIQGGKKDISSLKDALGNRMVIPQGVRPAQQLPDIYASGGSVQMPKEYSKGNWKLI